MIAAGATSCVVFLPLDGLSSGSSAPDGASTEEAGHEASDGDGTPAANDAGVEAAAVGCAAHPEATFCVDFEEPSALTKAVWSSAVLDGSTGTIALTDAAFVSPSHAASFDLVLPGGCQYLQLRRYFSGGYSRIKVEMSIKPATAGWIFSLGGRSAANEDLFAIAGTSGRQLQLRMQRYDGGSVTPVSSSEKLFPLDLAGSFHRLSFEHATATPKVMKVVLDGVEVMLDIPDDFVLRDPEIAIGPYCASSSHLDVDDVVVWLDP